MGNIFLQFYDQCFPDVYRYALKRTQNKWDAEDLVSDIFQKAFERYDGSQDKKWIMVITKYRILDYYRRKKFDMPGDYLEHFLPPFINEDRLEKLEELDCLRKSLSLLPKADSEIIVLRYFSEMKFKEISKLLTVPESTLRVKVMRTTNKLGSLLNKCLGEER